MTKKKQLARSQDNVLIAGVLSGLAEYFDQDPRLFRLVAVALLIITGIFPGLLVYLAAWIIMPFKKDAAADYDVS